MLYRLLVRPLLYALPAETAHRFVMGALALSSRLSPLVAAVRALCAPRDPRLAVEAFGLRFASPIGLAAGFDKDAEAFAMLSAIGFGFIEVGTVTARAQPGNPRPRLFRLTRDRALINRLGFNNHGAAAAAERLARRRRDAGPVGVNIGKTKLVPNEAALEDYAASAAQLARHADYLVVNVSSPNTPGLRDLQAVSSLRPLIGRVRAQLDAASSERRVPLLLKIAPDLSDEDVDAIADLAVEVRLDGIIATNTTSGRAGLTTPADEVEAYGAGGLSGPPLKRRALEVLRRLHARVGDRLVLVAAGGVETVEDVWERLRAGASLVQLYTALIYEGPGLPVRLAKQLSRKLDESRLAGVAELRKSSTQA